MGSGSDKDSKFEETPLIDRFPWPEELEEWDTSTRRKFLGGLLAVLTGILSAIGLYLRGMLGYFTPTEEEQNGDVEPPAEIEEPGDPPFDIHVREYEDEYKAIDSQGENIASGSDGWEILRKAVDVIPAGGTIFVQGRYEADSPIEINKSLQLDGYGATIELNESSKFIFEFFGEERFETELADSVSTGDYTVELESTDGIRPGDMVLLEDEDSEPLLGRDQPPGEPHSVLAVEDSLVSLEDTIVWREGYDSGTTVYVTDPIEIHCAGFDLESYAKDESYTGISARDCRNSTFKDLHVERFGSRGIALEGCANCRVRDCTVIKSADLESSDGYGIQIRAGCHDIVVEGCTGKECRHPLSVTPAGPREVASRSVIFRDCFVSADGSAALNCHGGSAHDVRFEGCMVHTRGEAGVRSGAQKTNVSGCEFRMDGHHAVTTRNDGQEMVVTVTDTDIYGASNAVELNDESSYEFNPLWKLVHIDGVRAYDCARFFEIEDGYVDRVRNLVIQNCSWDTVSAEGVRINNRVDGGSIEGNNFGYAPNDSHIRARNSDETEVRNLQIVNNRFQNSSGDHTFIRLSHAEECMISGNKFESENSRRIYADDTGSTHNVIKQNTYFAPGASGDSVAADSDSLVENNRFFDMATDGWS